MRQAKFFNLADEASDCNSKEQFAIFIRFGDDQSNSGEDFLWFFDFKEGTKGGSSFEAGRRKIVEDKDTMEMETCNVNIVELQLL